MLHQYTCKACGRVFASNNQSNPNKFCSRQCVCDHRAIAIADRFWARVDKSAGPNACWPWTRGTIPEGYGSFSWLGKTRTSHRLVWELTFGPIPDGTFVCHKCDNPSCCNPSHLFLGTPADNMADMAAKGRGVKLGNAKLTREQARSIRARHASGTKTATLAREYSVHVCTIHRILNLKSWK